MPLPKYQTAIEIINEVIVPQIDTNAQDIKAIAKEVVSNAKDFDKKVEEVYNALEAKEVETGGLFDTHKAGYTKYCDDLKAEIEKLTTQITSDTSTQDIGEIVDVLSSKIEALENEENFEYDDQELKDSITKLNVDFSVFKEKVLTSKSVIDEINSKEGVIEASSIKGLIQTLNDIANKGGNSNVKVGASILEILSNGTSVMQGATRLNFIGSTVTYNKGTIDITSSGGGSSSIGGTVTEGTAGSVLFINPAGILAQDNSNLFWDNTNKRLGIGTSAPGSRLTVKSSAVGTYVVNFLGNSGNSLFKFYDNGNTDDSIYQQSFQGTVKVQFSANGDSYFTGGKIGLGTNAPTHSLTLNSTSTGIALYNTADQTTNYERVLARWASNQFIIEQRNGGTGVGRSLLLQASDNADGNPAFINIFSASNVKIDMGLTGSFGGETNLVRIGSGTSLTASTAITQRFLEITGTINQATSAGYTALLVNPTETTTGSGSKLLADFQVGGTTKASIANTGNFTTIGTISSAIAGGGGANITITDSNTFGEIQTFNSKYLVLNKQGNNIQIGGTGTNPILGWGATTGTLDTGFSRTAAGALALGNGTNASTAATLSLAQVVTTPATITVTTNAGTVTRANRINNFTNSSAATMTITMSTTGAADGDSVIVRIKDFSAAAQTITWVNTENSTVTAPVTSNGSTTLPLTVGFQYNSATTKWRCIASA